MHGPNEARGRELVVHAIGSATAGDPAIAQRVTTNARKREARSIIGPPVRHACGIHAARARDDVSADRSGCCVAREVSGPPKLARWERRGERTLPPRELHGFRGES